MIKYNKVTTVANPYCSTEPRRRPSMYSLARHFAHREPGEIHVLQLAVLESPHFSFREPDGNRRSDPDYSKRLWARMVTNPIALPIFLLHEGTRTSKKLRSRSGAFWGTQPTR